MARPSMTGKTATGKITAGKTAARAARDGAGQAAAAGGRAAWIGGAACGALLTLAPAMLLLGVVLFLPSLISLIAERDAARRVSRAVALCNLAAALAPLWQAGRAVLAGTPALDAALDHLGAGLTLPVCWLAGATGWALCEILPVLLAALAAWQASRAIARIDAELAALQDEWDSLG